VIGARGRRWSFLAVAAAALVVAAAWLLDETRERAARAPAPGAPSAGRAGDGRAEGERRLAVEVVSEPGGTPLAGAEVALNVATRGARSVVATARTGADGRAELGDAGGSAPLVEARAPGHVGASLEPPPGTSSVRLSLRRLASIAGAVRDTADHPVAATAVLSLPPAARGAFAHMLPEEAPASGVLASRADETGRFAFAALPPADGYRIRVHAGSTLAEEERSLDLPPGACVSAEFVLRVAGGITGRFVSRAGAPLADAEVRVFRRDGAGWRQGHGTRSDAEGRFRFGGVQPGSVLVEAEHHDGALVSFAGASVAVEAERVADVGDLVPAPGELELLVLPGARAPPDPVPGVKVAILVVSRRTDSELPFASVGLRTSLGRPLTVAGLPEGELQVTAASSDPGLGRGEHRGWWSPATTPTRVEIVLDRAKAAAAVTVDLDGCGPLFGLALLVDGDVVGRFHPLPAGPLPSATFGKVAPGRPAEVWALARDAFRRVPVPPLEPGAKVTVRPGPPEPACRFAGVVRRPAAGQRVLLCLPGSDWPRGAAILDAAVEPSGRFRLEGVPPSRAFELCVAEGDRTGAVRLVQAPDPGGSVETLDLDAP